MYRSRPRRRPRRRVHRAARQGPGHPSRDAGHGHRLRPDGPLRARGGRPRRRGGDQRRGRRPPDAPAARQGDGPRLGPQDRQVPRSSTRTTGSAATARRSPRSSPRRRSTTSTGRSRGSPARTSRACPTTTSSRTGSWSTPRRSPTASASSPRTDAGVDRDAGELEAASSGRSSMPYRGPARGRSRSTASDAPPAGRQGPRLVRRREPAATASSSFSFLPMHAHPELLDEHLAGAPEAEARRVAVRVHVGRRRGGRGAGGARSRAGSTSIGLEEVAMPDSDTARPDCGAISTPSTLATSTQWPR